MQLSHDQCQIQGKMHHFPTRNKPHAFGPWDKSKSPYPMRNRIIPNSATIGGPGTDLHVVSWFLVPNHCPVGNYVISELVWVLPIVVWLTIPRHLLRDQELLGLQPHGSWSPTVASLGIRQFLNEYGFFLVYRILSNSSTLSVSTT